MYTSILFQAALLSVAQAHGVILAAQGIAGSPASVGFKVDDAIARNCTGISPCQQDTTIIRDSEIAANIVNECGRTELSGNIDVGENTENALSAGAVTKVKAGTLMTVTIHQVNADGAGPYTCDLDQTSNAGVISQNLTVTNNVPGVNGLSQAKTQDFNITVQMPDNLACTGASTGNICTVRCRNNAVAGPFGGCFAVQQTDVAATNNSANTISTAQTLKAIEAQVQENNVDLPVAVAANQAAGSADGVKGFNGANALLSASITSKAAPVMTLAVDNVGVNAAVASTTTTSSTSSAKATTTTAAKGNGKGNANAKGNGNGNGRNNNNKARGSSLKWASRLFAADSWEEPSN
ncbi:putative gas1-like protein [Botrytis fragariae]|uniref:Putative gas1-like protein n=1 Tax=Botrytis fragariae TaxID=1964551 RepID=A0A8H6B5L2_9HELO|nr:putative gas1-like protein [Botrytis fragariae]KAF5879643.1 putative gas1-like protein [Botrytis fragariae]